MKILHSLAEYDHNLSTTVTIGAFDGVHIGHQLVLDQLKQTAKTFQTNSLVITFVPHPRIFFSSDTDLRLLNSLQEKIELLAKQGIDYLVLQSFDAQFASQSPDIFVKNMTNYLHMKHLLMGYDHHFGKQQSGDFSAIKSLEKKYNFEVHQIDVLAVENVNISSSIIRNLLNEGKIKLANEYLSYPYMIEGSVVAGNHLGRTINFPTANVAVDDPYKLVPKKGVYIVKAQVVGQEIYGMMNIGKRPTVDGKNQTIEVYLLDFKQDIYGESIQISFLERLRDEQKFSSLEALKQQLLRDKEVLKNYVSNIKF